MKVWRTLFIISGVIPILGLFSKTQPGFMLLIYSIFVFLSVNNTFWNKIANQKTLAYQVILISFIVAALTETLAWLQNYFVHFPNPGALFSIHLIPDILIGSGYYLGLVSAFVIVASYYNFSLKQAFIAYGIFGIFIEQQGNVFKAAIQTAPHNLLIAMVLIFYVFLVHGSILGIAYIPIRNRLYHDYDKWYKYPIAWLAIFFGVWLGTAISGFFFGRLK